MTEAVIGAHHIAVVEPERIADEAAVVMTAHPEEHAVAVDVAVTVSFPPIAVVTAAAVVPVSVTSMLAGWITASRYRCSSFVMPERSALVGLKAVGIPIATRMLASWTRVSVEKRGNVMSTM